MPRINVVSPADAQGDLKTIYDDVEKRRGAVANVLQIQSLHPTTLKTHLDMYLSILYGKTALSRQERETIAVAVSRTNGCEYCVTHHADALSKYQKDPHAVGAISKGGVPETATLREKALINFSKAITSAPAAMGDQHTQALRDAGFQDEEILMATLTAAYFNFVNRVVHTLGVDLEEGQAHYKY